MPGSKPRHTSGARCQPPSHHAPIFPMPDTSEPEMRQTGGSALPAPGTYDPQRLLLRVPRGRRMLGAAESIWECLGSGPRRGACCIWAPKPCCKGNISPLCWQSPGQEPCVAGGRQGPTCTASQPMPPMPWGVWQQVAPQDMAGMLPASPYGGEPIDTPSLEQNGGERGTPSHCHIGIGPQTTQSCDSS